jgi:hypothetical protein
MHEHVFRAIADNGDMHIGSPSRLVTVPRSSARGELNEPLRAALAGSNLLRLSRADAACWMVKQMAIGDARLR